MAMLIAILEDNADRVLAMKKWLDDRLSMYDRFITNDPHELIDKLRERMEDVLAVSLDHDLHERPDGSTELTGMMVVDFLGTQRPRFPVLLHTSNVRDGETMKRRLLSKEWRVTWVTPFDDTTWIGNDWYPTLKKAIQRGAIPERVPASGEKD